METALSVRRNASIDFIKGIAITGVVMGHTCAFPILPADWRWGVCYVVAGIGIPILLNRIFVHFSCGFNVLFRQFKRFKHEVVRP